MDISERLDALVRHLGQAADTDAVTSIVDREIRRLGFDMFAYVQLRAPKGARHRPYIGTYPLDWVLHYYKENLQLYDPVLGHAFHALRPFLWEGVRAAGDMPMAEEMVFRPGADAGLRTGGGIPLHGPDGAVASLQVSMNCSPEVFAPLFAACRHELQLIAYNAHDRIIELTAGTAAARFRPLSPRQKEVLLWAVRGKTNWEIGELMGITEDTVRQHLINVSRRLGASNRTQAATLAVARQLVIL